ncbi:MAG: hypothetical protein AAAFM81_01110 [Pseudomonadota bacterium]
MNDAIDKVQALPILLLVLASLLSGCGIWCLIRTERLPALAALLIGLAIALFIGAGVAMRNRQLILRKDVR